MIAMANIKVIKRYLFIVKSPPDHPQRASIIEGEEGQSQKLSPSINSLSPQPPRSSRGTVAKDNAGKEVFQYEPV
jgi:hypothetical protein